MCISKKLLDIDRERNCTSQLLYRLVSYSNWVINTQKALKMKITSILRRFQ